MTCHCPLGWHFCSRDDCRCNYRNSCSVDVRSEIFEEDPCPGTGKYIEAQYYCLGWCTLFYSTDEQHFLGRRRARDFFQDSTRDSTWRCCYKNWKLQRVRLFCLKIIKISWRKARASEAVRKGRKVGISSRKSLSIRVSPPFEHPRR